MREKSTLSLLISPTPCSLEVQWAEIQSLVSRWLSGKGSTCQYRRLGSSGWILGGGNGKTLRYSYLDNHMGRRAWQEQSMELQRVRHDWATEVTCICCNRIPTNAVALNSTKSSCGSEVPKFSITLPRQNQVSADLCSRLEAQRKSALPFKVSRGCLLSLTHGPLPTSLKPARSGQVFLTISLLQFSFSSFLFYTFKDVLHCIVPTQIIQEYLPVGSAY